MAEDNVSDSSMAETPVASPDSDITNKDVYEFYKIHKDSENTDRFLDHFGVDISANPSTLYKNDTRETRNCLQEDGVLITKFRHSAVKNRMNNKTRYYQKKSLKRKATWRKRRKESVKEEFG